MDSSDPINNGIKQWPLKERPRERMLSEGVESLSDAELLAVLIRNGIAGKDAVSFSREMMVRFGGLRGLLAADFSELKKMKGLGPAKSASILAAMEIAKRHLREEMLGKNMIHDPKSVVDFLMCDLRDQKKEIFKVIFLNRGNQIIDELDLFIGTVDQAMVHPREVVKVSLERHATAVVLVHNHPSGRVEPSREDKDVTNRLAAALETVNIRLLDHIIIGDNRYFSFREHQLIRL